MIRSFSLVTLAALVLVGCGSTGGTDDTKKQGFVAKNNKVSSIAALQQIGNDKDINVKSLNSVSSSASSSYKPENNSGNPGYTEPCQSGSLSFNESANNTAFSFDAQNCVDGSNRIDGALNLSMSEDGKSIDAQVTRKITFKEGSDNLSIEQDSQVTLNNQSLLADFKATINGVLFSADNIQASIVDQGENGSVSFSSGSLNVAGYYFEFVSQDVPFSGGETLDRGLLKLKDGAGHAVQVKVESADHVAIMIDENGDNTFSESEIMRFNLQEEFSGAAGASSDDAVTAKAQ